VQYFDSLAALEEKIREFKDLFRYDEQTFKHVSVPESSKESQGSAKFMQNGMNKR
jgi:hypothetical protein